MGRWRARTRIVSESPTSTTVTHRSVVVSARTEGEARAAAVREHRASAPEELTVREDMTIVELVRVQ